jgi:microcompartment protein CcmL/EutN
VVNYNALGLIETFGIVFVLEAADAMVKAADVELIGYENTASGYISVLVSGDVAACKTAVDAGVKAVADMGTEVYSSVVIPSPHPDLAKIIDRYTLDKLLPYPPVEPKAEPVAKKAATK